MELTMSMFATQADYWKTRAELAETVVAEVAHELGCENDNEAILTAIDALKPPTESTIATEIKAARNEFATWPKERQDAARVSAVAMTPTTESTIAAKCQRIEGSGEICGLTPPCPDCGPSLIDVAEDA